MLQEVESPLSGEDAAALSALGKLLLNCGFGMLLRSYREVGLRTGTLDFDRTFSIAEVGDLIDLFCVGRPAPAVRVEAAIGSAAVAAFLKHKTLVQDNGLLRARDLRLIDHLGAFLFVGAQSARKTLYFGDDSAALGSWLLGAPRGCCLDLCCGVGTQTVLCARHGGEAIGVDCNRDAIRVAHINAALNGVTGRVRFYEGDVLQTFADPDPASVRALGLFDTVCCNPPLLPAPAVSALPLVADGGEDGLSFLARILPALPALLEPDGRCYMTGTILGSEEQPDLSRIERIAEDYALRIYMVVPAFRDIRRGEIFRSMLEITSIFNSSTGGLDSEGVSKAWDQVTTQGTHLYSFCLVATRAKQKGRGSVEFTRHYQRNESFWQV
jgi:methylase of polypeptide subunit release factors